MSGKSSLVLTRVKMLAEQVYKVLHNLSPPLEATIFTRKPLQYDMRDNFKLALPKFNYSQYGKCSIRYKGAKLWNTRPQDIKNVDCYTDF